MHGKIPWDVVNRLKKTDIVTLLSRHPPLVESPQVRNHIKRRPVAKNGIGNRLSADAPECHQVIENMKMTELLGSA